MTQMGEGIGNAIVSETAVDCPFEHSDGKYDRTNDFSNNSQTLGGNLNPQSNVQVSVTVRSRTKQMSLAFQAHHLIPGQAIRNPLLRQEGWMTGGKTVKGDVGYRQNDGWNGVWLPALHAFKGWGGETRGGGYEIQFAYAYYAMKSNSWKQFHMWDWAHGDYNGWVSRTLDKYCVKMKELQRDCKACRDSGNTQKPFRPPYRINDWLCALARRLEGYLEGSPTSWRPPLFTSEFAVMVYAGHTPETLAAIE